jgi:hypothetical protein
MRPGTGTEGGAGPPFCIAELKVTISLHSTAAHITSEVVYSTGSSHPVEPVQRSWMALGSNLEGGLFISWPRGARSEVPSTISGERETATRIQARDPVFNTVGAVGVARLSKLPKLMKGELLEPFQRRLGLNARIPQG